MKSFMKSVTCVDNFHGKMFYFLYSISGRVLRYWDVKNGDEDIVWESYKEGIVYIKKETKILFSLKMAT